MALLAAVFCYPDAVSACETVSRTGTMGGRLDDGISSQSEMEENTLNDDAACSTGTEEDPETGMLVLEDPDEETRYAEYAMAVGECFSVTFVHSVNKSPVTDYFEIREDGIYGIRTVYYGFGAGVPTELEEGQTLTYGEDGSMIISGLDVKMNDLIYRVGTVSDHILTLADGSEVSLRELCGRSARVGFRFVKDSDLP